MTRNKLKRRTPKRSEVWAAYGEAGPEFGLLRQLVEIRQEAGLTQAQVAARVRKKAPGVTRLGNHARSQ